MSSRLEEWGARLIADDGPNTPSACLARSFLTGCAGLYDAGLEAYLLAELLRLRRREHLPVPVVSIGNLTVGGTGKTPMTQLLCRLLTGQKKRIAVLSRGHGGQGVGARLVSDTSRVLLKAAASGDEPLLLARTLPGVPVLVGKDRRDTGREALRRFGLDAIVLDDGFQYWQLARDLDIVLLDGRRPFDNGFPLPRGLLREPKRHLARAGMVVVTRADRLGTKERAPLIAEIGHLAPNADPYFATHQPVGFVPVSEPGVSVLPRELLYGQTVVALSGIAQPQSFASSLSAMGIVISRHLVYADHAAYTNMDVEAVHAALVETGASALVMTEKDAVKWPLGQISDVPSYALRIEMRLEDESRFQAAIMHRLFGEH